jgi:hypothetical protein
MNTTIARRLGVLAAGASLALGGLVPAAQAATSSSAALGSSWIAGDLPANNVYTNPYGSGPTNDPGLTIDAGLAAVAAGDTALVARVQQGVASLVAPLNTSSASSSAIAKALAFATRSGANPRSFGDLDFVALMEARIEANGRISGTSSFAVFGQALAAEGLSAAGSSKAPAVVSYLQALQCASGGFGNNTAATGVAPTCATSGSTIPDNASLVGASVAHIAPTASINTTLDKIGAFLVSAAVNGAYEDGYAPGTNANSTGLAASVLGASCRVVAADAAADAVRALQVPAGASGPLTGESGAVAPTQADLDAAQEAGITDPFVRDSFRRATTQAVTGLVWDTSAPASISIAGPSAPVAAGSAQTLAVSGVAKGETLCLTTPAGVTRLLGTGGTISVPVTAPATGSATYSATTGPGTATRTITAAAPVTATAPVALAATVAGKKLTPGSKVKVKLVGLTAGKKITVKIGKTTVKKTKAKATSGKVTFKLPKKIKPGKTTVKIKTAGKTVKVKLTIKAKKKVKP